MIYKTEMTHISVFIENIKHKLEVMNLKKKRNLLDLKVQKDILEIERKLTQ